VADIPALSAFLEEDEELRVGFSGRLIHGAGLAGSALRLPSPLRGAVWVADARDSPDERPAPALAGAVLCHPSRLVFPVFPREGPEGDGDLALLCSSFSPASIIGMAGDVARYEAALGLAPRASVPYRLMTLPKGLRATLPVRPRAGLSVRRATLDDLDALTPLQEAYEREEVLTPIHSFNGPACRASLARALERQLMYAAEEGGVIVGKAGTNARGFRVDQIGGVYTLPSRRGRGVAAALMAALLAEILAQGRRPALFAKPANAPAQALYMRLGFENIGDYRADYLEA
jgi:uncharacterized protein